ncbi:MAG: peptide chain release factor 2 [Armatimonadota bacterium]|nr:peptide chain release factor 2 [Armatimonadota bacterium]
MVLEAKRELDGLLDELTELGGHLDLAGKQARIGELEKLTGRSGFWDDPQQAQKTMQELNSLKADIDPWLSAKRQLDDLEVLAEIVEETKSATDVHELETELGKLKAKVEALELSTLLGGEHDASNAIIEINAGAGGTEACDWVDMLTRMYLRWAEDHGFHTEMINSVPGESAGSKNVTFTVEGRNVFGYLKSERGVHRLVRISPFDANKRRHTTFASVSVMPEIEESEVEINSDELKIDTYRASSAGGQHVNKTDSAVRITHIPTGLVVTCQNERSQLKNKENALKVLQSRLWQIQREENEARLAEIRGDLAAIEWGNQIRSYVFQPYTMVKDHRTGAQTGDVIRVMDGKIDDFIQAYLRS